MDMDSFVFDKPEKPGYFTKVLGVGRSGINAVSNMFRKGLPCVDFVVCDVASRELNESPVEDKIVLDSQLTCLDSNPEYGRMKAMEKADEIRDTFASGTSLLVIVAGMGGGCGTGAAPVIAQVVKSIAVEDSDNEHITVVAIVTFPFSFEGTKRIEQAKEGVNELCKYVDSIIVLNNDVLSSFGDLTMANAFAKADDMMLSAVRGITGIVGTEDAFSRNDLRDVMTMLSHSGTALVAKGRGNGTNRIVDAIADAAVSPFLSGQELYGAKGVFVHISMSHGHELTMDEYGRIFDCVCGLTNTKPNMMTGFRYDENLGDAIEIVIVATNF